MDNFQSYIKFKENAGTVSGIFFRINHNGTKIREGSASLTVKFFDKDFGYGEESARYFAAKLVRAHYEGFVTLGADGIEIHGDRQLYAKAIRNLLNQLWGAAELKSNLE